MDIFFTQYSLIIFSMKRFYALLTLLGIALCGVAQVPAIIAVGADGQEQTYQLSLAKEIVFETAGDAPTMQLNLLDGTQVVGLTEVLFGSMDPDVPTNITGTEAPMVYIFPNPVVATLYVSGVGDNTQLQVFDLSGKLIKSDIGSSISVDNLQQGTYLLRIENKVVKFIKQ